MNSSFTDAFNPATSKSNSKITTPKKPGIIGAPTVKQHVLPNKIGLQPKPNKVDTKKKILDLSNNAEEFF